MADETMTLEQVHDALQTLLTPTRVKRTDRLALCLRIQSAYESAIAERKGADLTALRNLYTAASKGFHTSETCGAEYKYLHNVKFKTLQDLLDYEHAWYQAMAAAAPKVTP